MRYPFAGFLVFLSLSCELAARNPPEQMLRFWRGYKQEDIKLAEFQKNVNAKLIPETTNVGAGQGLLAYLPAFLETSGRPHFPHEIALIVYSSPDAYNAIRATPAGLEYGPLHFEKGLIAKETKAGLKSGSLLVGSYSGSVSLKSQDAAFHFGSMADWQKGKVHLRILELADKAANETQYARAATDYLDSWPRDTSSIGIDQAVVLVDKKYLLVLVQGKAESETSARQALSEMERRNFRLDSFFRYEEQPSTKTSLRNQAGINVQFETRPLHHVEPATVPEMPCAAALTAGGDCG